MDGVNSTATTVGNIAEQLNAQSYSALSNYQQSLPSIVGIDNAAYGFQSSLQNAQMSSTNSLAQNLFQGIQSISQSNQQMFSRDTSAGIGQYNQIAQTGKRKK